MATAQVISPLEPLSQGLSKLSISRTPALDTNPDLPLVRSQRLDTSYEPSLKLWEADTKAYQKPATLELDPLPEGFPDQTDGPTLWNGKELVNQPEKWLHQFTAEEIADVQQAAAHFDGLKLPYSAITQETFPLSVLKPTLAKVVEEIHHGLGLRILRGLPVQTWDRHTQIIVFAGISAYIGRRLKQQSTSAIIHLRDLTQFDPKERPRIVLKGQTNANQVFHTDAGDIVGLITLGRAEKGGLSQLSSIARTYNEFAETRRDILRTLAKPDWISAQHPNGAALFYHLDRRVVAQYARRPFFGFYDDPNRPKGVPPLKHEQHVALDAIHFTAEKFSLDIDLQPGDLEYFNNLQVFHARTESEDSQENTRHLLRVWLRNEEHALNHGPDWDIRWKNLVEPFDEKFPLEAWEPIEDKSGLPKARGY